MAIDKDTGEITGPLLFLTREDRHLVRTRYNYDTNRVSNATGLSCGEKTRTQQQFREETDINTIVKKFGLTGELPQNLRVPQSGDFTNVPDYQTAMNLVRQAQESFMELPAQVRARFHNDPQELQMFVQDEKNLEEARRLGIAVPAKAPPPPPEPILVKVAPDPAAKPPAQSST